MTRRIVLVVAIILTGCANRGAAKDGSNAPPSTPPPPTDHTPPATSMTEFECVARGGHSVGDIGDGAIHQPGYVCPDSGKPPLGTVSAEPGQPVPTEGAVCCL